MIWYRLNPYGQKRSNQKSLIYKEKLAKLCSKDQFLISFLLRTQERVEETRSTCSNLEQDIKKMLSKKRTLREHISNIKWNAIGERQTLQKYRSKMETFEKIVQKYLDESQLQKDVMEKETELTKGKENCKFFWYP